MADEKMNIPSVKSAPIDNVINSFFIHLVRRYYFFRALKHIDVICVLHPVILKVFI